MCTQMGGKVTEHTDISSGIVGSFHPLLTLQVMGRKLDQPEDLSHLRPKSTARAA
jgi:hypothetical protein